MSESSARTLALRSRAASIQTATLPTSVRHAVLDRCAEHLRAQASELLAANALDLAAAEAAGLDRPKIQRLALDAAKIESMAAGLETIVSLPDPLGTVTRDTQLENGLQVQRVRVPLGAILMIYEARPNVTIDAFALCLAAGNACLLKGGREASHSNAALLAIAHQALTDCDVTPDAVQLIDTSDRDFIRELLRQSDALDLVIPRGGESLIRFVHEHTTIPTVLHFHGVCHVVVDRDADLSKAVAIVRNGKVSAPATCNATEAVLVHREVADVFLPALATALAGDGVEIRGDEVTCAILPDAVAATDDDWGHEFLDLILAVRVVDDLEAALAHVEIHGSRHTDAIVSEDRAAQERFLSRAGSSCALVNASTRFNDGGQLGLGAEIGISTTRVHAFGPMGIEELTTQRWVVRGDGQVR